MKLMMFGIQLSSMLGFVYDSPSKLKPLSVYPGFGSGRLRFESCDSISIGSSKKPGMCSAATRVLRPAVLS